MALKEAEMIAPAVQPEDVRWTAEIDAGLPAGDDLTGAELRIDYLLERIQEERAKVEHVKEFTRRRIAMVTEHADREIAGTERRLRWLENGVRGNAPMDAQDFEGAYGKRSQKLPHGEYGFRRAPDSLAVEDEAAAVAWAEKECPAAVKVERRILKTALKAAVAATGECEGPGWKLVPGAESFFVRAAGAS